MKSFSLIFFTLFIQVYIVTDKIHVHLKYINQVHVPAQNLVAKLYIVILNNMLIVIFCIDMSYVICSTIRSDMLLVRILNSF